MGNCGFTLAPVRASELDLVLSNLERAEAIPAAAIRAGIDFCWETFSEFFDALEQTAKGINYAGYVGHSALRTYAMGERAFSEPANNDELAVMVEQLENAMRAGLSVSQLLEIRATYGLMTGRLQVVLPPGTRCAT
jgi:N-acyl-D-amino-acid deacylase